MVAPLVGLAKGLKPPLGGSPLPILPKGADFESLLSMLESLVASLKEGVEPSGSSGAPEKEVSSEARKVKRDEQDAIRRRLEHDLPSSMIPISIPDSRRIFTPRSTEEETPVDGRPAPAPLTEEEQNASNTLRSLFQDPPEETAPQVRLPSGIVGSGMAEGGSTFPEFLGEQPVLGWPVQALVEEPPTESLESIHGAVRVDPAEMATPPNLLPASADPGDAMSSPQAIRGAVVFSTTPSLSMVKETIGMSEDVQPMLSRTISVGAGEGRSEGPTPRLLTDKVPSAGVQDRVDFIEHVVRAARMTQARGSARLKLVLDPPHLGPLRVDLAMKEKVLHGTLSVETQAAKDMIVSNLQGLREQLEQQGIRVADLQVNVYAGFDQPQRDLERRPQTAAQTLVDAPQRSSRDDGETPTWRRRVSHRVQVLDMLV